MVIKKFVEKYNAIATDRLKEDYLKDNIKITTYVPFVKKVTYATTLAQNTMIDKETGNVKVSSESNYLFFVRSIIELYTDLEIENKAFYDEYDLLNESGLLDKIMQMIPEKEVTEFKMLCDMKKSDIIQNKYEMHSFISEQVGRISDLLKVVSEPFIQELSKKLDTFSEAELRHLANVISGTFSNNEEE